MTFRRLDFKFAPPVTFVLRYVRIRNYKFLYGFPALRESEAWDGETDGQTLTDRWGATLNAAREGRVIIATRSQAVARIADRTAKYSMGHVTRPRPLLGEIFVRPLVILHTKPCTKFEVSSLSNFGDMFDNMPKILGVT